MSSTSTTFVVHPGKTSGKRRSWKDFFQHPRFTPSTTENAPADSTFSVLPYKNPMGALAETLEFSLFFKI